MKKNLTYYQSKNKFLYSELGGSTHALPIWKCLRHKETYQRVYVEDNWIKDIRFHI